MEDNEDDETFIIFKTSDYDLDTEERERKFEKYELILCDNCNQDINIQNGFVCEGCYYDEIDVIEKTRLRFGRCKECYQINTECCWCLPCNSIHFQQDFDKWTSGYEIVDELIQDSQFSARPLEWIPFDRFTDIKYINKGGTAKVYSATLLDGRIIKWDIISNNWKRCQPHKVALKIFNYTSVSISDDFLNELKTFKTVIDESMLNCYGVTKDPITQCYALVLEFLENDSLYSYINQNINLISWELKFTMITCIIVNLSVLHEANLIHKDLHAGNVLLPKDYMPYISNFGCCGPVIEELTTAKAKKIYGVLPYIAPEVLCGNEHTQASDIYSFGIIINQLISEIPPFNHQSHDHYLALDICRGLRPTIREETPDIFKEIIQRCWDANPKNRPTSESIFAMLDYFENVTSNRYEEFIKLTNLSSIPQLSDESHPRAIYTSRTLHLPNLPEPVNYPNQEEFVFTKAYCSSVDKNSTSSESSDTPHFECNRCQNDNIDEEQD